MNSFMLNSVRHKVSADKNRYQKDDYDLDLTYITDRIVAMAFPAEGMEATYRNNIDNVASLMKEKHKNHYILYNLSNRPYDCNKFNGNVINWCGFPDHHPPPIALLFRIVHSIHEWLHGDPKNIAVIHCLAGKGRTGVVIACYFLYCGLFTNINQSLNYFSYRRSINTWGVTGPSQLRYMDYFSDILHGKSITHLGTMHLRQMTMSPIPRFSIGAGERGCSPFFEIYQLNREKMLLYSSENGDEINTHDISEVTCTFPVTCMIQGDILIQFKHITPMHTTEPMFHFVFNVGMVHTDRIRLYKGELEKAEKDVRFPSGFCVELLMEPCTDPTYHLKPSQKELQLASMMKRAEPVNPGAVCFTGRSSRIATRIALARDIGDACSGSISVKGGWLYKRGHTVKNWKRRWFVLRGTSLIYYKNPRSLKASGEIFLDSIEYIESTQNEEMPFCFEIVETKTNLLMSAGTAPIASFWVDALRYAISIRQKQYGGLHPLASLTVGLRCVQKIHFHGHLCCTVSTGKQSFTVKALKIDAKTDTLRFDKEMSLFILDPSLPVDIVLWINDWEVNKETKLARIQLSLDIIKVRAPNEEWYFLPLYPDAPKIHESVVVQLLAAFDFHEDGNYDERVSAEQKLLYVTEQRSALLPDNIINREEERHHSFSKYLHWHTIRKSMRRVPDGDLSPLSPSTMAFRQHRETSPKPFKPAQLPQTRGTATNGICLRNALDSSFVPKSGLTTLHAGPERYFQTESYFTCFLYLPDVLWTGDDSGTICIWNYHSGTPVQSFQAHESSIKELLVVENDVWSCAGEMVTISNISTATVIKKIKLKSSVLKVIPVFDEEVGCTDVWISAQALDSTAGSIIVYSAVSMKCKKRIKMNSSVGSLCAGEELVWAGAVDFILGFSAKDLTLLRRIKVGLGMVNQLHFVDDVLWMSCQEYQGITIVDSEREEIAHQIPSEASVRVLSRVGDFFWSAIDTSIIIWDIATKAKVIQLESSHKLPVQGIASLTDHLVASVSSHGIGIWKYNDGTK